MYRIQWVGVITTHSLILLLLAAGAGVSHAQRWESAIALHSGLFHFRGSSAQSSSFIVMEEQPEDDYTNNPYGSRSALCYGIGFNARRTIHNNLIYGAELSLEVLRSKTEIDGKVSYYPASGNAYFYPATGRSNMSLITANLYPHTGYRLKFTKQLNIDLLAGLDLSYCFSAREQGTVNRIGHESETSNKLSVRPFDFRPRIQINARYGGAALFLGYSYGLANYGNKQSTYIGAPPELKCYSRVVRFGLMINLKL